MVVWGYLSSAKTGNLFKWKEKGNQGSNVKEHKNLRLAHLRFTCNHRVTFS